MKLLNHVLPAFLIAAGIFFLGVFIKAGFDNFTNRDRVITVRGLAEKEVMANKVTWPIVCKEVGNDLPAIYDKITSTNNALIKFLTSNGITQDEISINAPDIVDLQAERYGSRDFQYRYNVTSVVVVTSKNVEKVNELIKRQTELLKEGIAITAGDYNYQTLYEYTDLNKIKPGMIAEATHNAREAADKFAADSHSKIGKIKTATQGQFSIENRDPYTPYIKNVRVVSSIVFYIED